MSRPYKVMIDPGHGGRDLGAVANDILEKDINLAVALKLRQIVIKEDYLFVPMLTRDEDHFVSLGDRCLRANTAMVSSFISLHCNARPSRGKEGIEIEVYYYSGSYIGKTIASILFNFLFQAVNENYIAIARGIKQGNYYVLRKTSMPAALVEMGFLTDPEEASWLNNPNNQRVLAKAIAEGIEISLEGGGI